MGLKNSPSGAYFPYPYKGGELFGIHLGSYGKNEDGLIKMMKAEEAFFLDQNRKMGIWVDFYENKMTDRVISEFITFIEHVKPRVSKLGIVGCSFWDRRKIQKLIRKTPSLSDLPVKFEGDPEVVKTWLVSERE